MRRLMLAMLGLLAGCGGTTGSELVSFDATAAGPADAYGGALTFATATNATVTLTGAKLHLGAIYLNQSRPVSGAATEPCVLPGIYVAQALGPVDVDLLSPTPVPFPTTGEGTRTEALTAEVWLSGPDVNTIGDTPVILSVAGTVAVADGTYPFSAQVTIGANRLPATTVPSEPSANPICHQRIVTPISIDLTPTNGGLLSVRIDPRPMFTDVEFPTVANLPAGTTTYVIPDDNSQAGEPLFKGLVANVGVYDFTWQEHTP